ncbi:lysin A, protease C39 domain [Gordonia phage Commandaria]|uniref:Lysin A, protease C39 domain n=1 Tax=Gordonia phage Commandaria TaxID=3038364 RepID=A0AAF0K7F3_9CAUD|nr:lysin A, protease C39 domain [Gordonia phage Commandaria]WGH20831.1 lysin A, protease C39 domain [Gordonia phage Commandaria]
MAAGDVVLDFDHVIIPQETYYWCGPATMQVLLSIRGIKVTEKYMADQLGTTVNGTDTILYLTRELNERLGDIYRTVQVPGRGNLDQFREHVFHSIDAGYGVGGNIMVPPSNYPRPQRGERARYSGDWVYHYWSIVAYNRRLDQMAIADSGFPDYFYWVTSAQALSMIEGKGYTWAANAKVQDDFLGSLTDAEIAKVLAGAAQVGEPHRGQ